ncbi:replication protein A 70 kDa DNA-binding subunit B-like isoform X2 [Oryza sativa Japonica Group]|uniref:replication protein A 70 kDa DNA-binding subunit B-like isoform X2 n=1 Tax=Oryza sativa subsp. japonica TaxID=39947 RepID=UPI00339BEE61
MHAHAVHLFGVFFEHSAGYLDAVHRVKNANRSYKPVANELMITFTRWTTVEECIEVPIDFPTVVFSLTPFDDVAKFVDNNDFFIDVMGVITDISTPTMLRPRSRDADSLKRTIQIRDANNSTLNVSLWAEQASAFEADAIHKAGKSEPQIILFVGTLAKNYPGIGLALSGGSACKWTGTNFQPINWIEAPARAAVEEVAENKTVRELLEINPHKCKKVRFQAHVTVRRICNDKCWWYGSCQRCFKVAKPYGSTYKCTSCSNIAVAVPRYRIVVIAGDDSDDAMFVLFG